jgi:FixJ family two-component response regulator
MRAGAVEFLSKPFSEEALLTAIGKALQTRGQNSQNKGSI